MEGRRCRVSHVYFFAGCCTFSQGIQYMLFYRRVPIQITGMHWPCVDGVVPREVWLNFGVCNWNTGSCPAAKKKKKKESREIKFQGPVFQVSGLGPMSNYSLVYPSRGSTHCGDFSQLNGSLVPFRRGHRAWKFIRWRWSLPGVFSKYIPIFQ